MIKAVIFDCFGVLTTDGWLAFKDAYLQNDSQKLAAASELNHQVDAGLIDQLTFEQGIARIAGVSDEVTHHLVDGHVRNDALFRFIANEIKPHFKVGLLSNVSSDVTPELFTPEQNALFDAKVFSYQLGVIKPHAAMYETIALKLDASVGECLFIDDREGFVQGAIDIGMSALQFHDNQQACRDIVAALKVERDA